MRRFLLAHSLEASLHSWLGLLLRVQGEAEYHGSGKCCLNHSGQEHGEGRDKGQGTCF